MAFHFPDSTDRSVWRVWQYDRPGQGDGTVMAFHRRESGMSAGTFSPQGLDGGEYEVENPDTGGVFRADGALPAREGLTIRLPERRSSAVFIYRNN